jgi:MFS transporter, DHA1 family, inner membrane transport protein
MQAPKPIFMASQVTSTAMPYPLPVARTPWRLMALLYAAGLLAAFQYAKIPYMLPGLAGQTLMSPVQQAIALSVIGIAGAVAGTFAGALCQAAGLRRTLWFGLLVGVLGALLAPVASSYAVLLLARVVESVAHMAIVVAVPTLMLALCAPADRPRVMALWSCYFTLTFIIAAIVVPTLVQAAGWQGIAVLHAAMLAAVAALCFWLPPGDTLRSDRALSIKSLLNAQLRLVGQGKLLAIPATFFGYTLLFVALVSTLPALLAETAQAAAVLALLLPGASLVGTVISLTALSKGVSGHRLVRISATGILLAGACLMLTPARGLAAQGVVMATFVLLGTLPAGIISSIPALFKPGDPDITLVNGGLVQFGNLGNFVGAPILAAMLLKFGWASVGVYLIVGGLVVSVCLLFLRHFAVQASSTQST